MGNLQVRNLERGLQHQLQQAIVVRRDTVTRHWKKWLLKGREMVFLILLGQFRCSWALRQTAGRNDLRVLPCSLKILLDESPNPTLFSRSPETGNDSRRG